MPKRNSKILRVRGRRFLSVTSNKASSIRRTDLSPRELAEKALRSLDLLIEFNEKTNAKSREILARAYAVAGRAEYGQSHHNQSD